MFSMDIIIERACGLDVHKDNITGCIITTEGKEIKTFSTKTIFLLELVEWIKEYGCTHVAMESTLIPDRNQRELRELVRYRRSIIEERARQYNRIQKVLEGANIKLGSVVSDIMGVSAREMLESIAEGNDDLDELASFARGVMKKKKDELKLALQGYIQDHQRFMIKTILKHIDFLTDEIEKLDIEVAKRLDGYQEEIKRLDSIPGIAIRMAEQMLAEIGTDIKNQFPSAAQMCSWAGLVPGNNESAGKRKSSKTRKGNKYLKSALIEAAHTVRGSKNYLGALYRRTAARKGKKRAGVVVAHAILRISYYLLTREEMYVDLGEDYFDKQRQQSIVRHSVRRLEGLGYTVTREEPKVS